MISVMGELLTENKEYIGKVYYNPKRIDQYIVSMLVAPLYNQKGGTASQELIALLEDSLFEEFEK